MLQAKFQDHKTPVLEKKSFKGFYHNYYMGVTAILVI